MATYYVREQGATIQKADQRLIVIKDSRELTHIPLHQLDQLIIMGNVQLTTQAMSLLLNAGIDVVFMSTTGKMRGRLSSDDSKYAELRVRQLQALSDPTIALGFAKRIVAGKVLNQEELLTRQVGRAALSTPREEHAALDLVTPARQTGGLTELLRGMHQMLNDGLAAQNADTLRGFEGKAATYYWPAFKQLLQRDLGFQGRVYRPPTDPVNALLSFGYALLQKDVTAAAKLVGFDPYLGFFHTVQYGRPSLVLDLMEEFRPVVVDAIVLDLINSNRLVAADFKRETPGAPAVTLKPEPLSQVIKVYEERLEQITTYQLTGEQVSLRRCIELQTRQLARVVKGEAEQFMPLALGRM